jgi:hypothetical protein
MTHNRSMRYALAAVGVALSIVGASAQPQSLPRVESSASVLEGDWVAEAGLTCGWTFVPQTRERPLGPTICLPVIIVKARDAKVEAAKRAESYRRAQERIWDAGRTACIETLRGRGIDPGADNNVASTADLIPPIRYATNWSDVPGAR